MIHSAVLLEQSGKLVASAKKRAVRQHLIIWNFNGPTIFARTGQKLIYRLTGSMPISTLPPMPPCNWQPKRKQLHCPDILERPPATEVLCYAPHAAKAGHPGAMRSHPPAIQNTFSPRAKRRTYSQIAPELAKEVLAPIWHKTPETANRLRLRCEAVIDFAKAHGGQNYDPPCPLLRAMARRRLRQQIPKNAICLGEARA